MNDEVLYLLGYVGGLLNCIHTTDGTRVATLICLINIIASYQIAHL
jgi:hypothetical protein